MSDVAQLLNAIEAGEPKAAWLRLISDGADKFQNRAHFFGAAAEAMRRILDRSL